MFSGLQICEDEEQHLGVPLPPLLQQQQQQQRARKRVGSGEDVQARNDTAHLAGGSGALQVCLPLLAAMRITP